MPITTITTLSGTDCGSMQYNFCNSTNPTNLEENLIPLKIQEDIVTVIQMMRVANKNYKYSPEEQKIRRAVFDEVIDEVKTLYRNDKKAPEVSDSIKNIFK